MNPSGQNLTQFGDSLRKGQWKKAYDQNPFLAIGLAAGVGYVLGRGLFTPLTGRMLKLGAKAFVLPRVSTHVEALTDKNQNQ